MLRSAGYLFSLVEYTRYIKKSELERQKERAGLSTCIDMCTCSVRGTSSAQARKLSNHAQVMLKSTFVLLFLRTPPGKHARVFAREIFSKLCCPACNKLNGTNLLPIEVDKLLQHIFNNFGTSCSQACYNLLTWLQQICCYQIATALSQQSRYKIVNKSPQVRRDKLSSAVRRHPVDKLLGQNWDKLSQACYDLCVFHVYTRDYSKEILLLHKSARIGKISVNIASFQKTSGLWLSFISISGRALILQINVYERN